MLTTDFQVAQEKKAQTHTDKANVQNVNSWHYTVDSVHCLLHYSLNFLNVWTISQLKPGGTPVEGIMDSDPSTVPCVTPVATNTFLPLASPNLNLWKTDRSISWLAKPAAWNIYDVQGLKVFLTSNVVP